MNMRKIIEGWADIVKFCFSQWCCPRLIFITNFIKIDAASGAVLYSRQRTSCPSLAAPSHWMARAVLMEDFCNVAISWPWGRKKTSNILWLDLGDLGDLVHPDGP